MKFKTTFDRKANLRMHKVDGKLDKDILLAKLNEIYSMSEYDPDMNVLWDIREADLSSFNFTEVATIKELAGSFWGTAGKSKAALIVSRDVEYGLTRMYSTLLKNKTNSEVYIFRNYDEALAWIKK